MSRHFWLASLGECTRLHGHRIDLNSEAESPELLQLRLRLGLHEVPLAGGTIYGAITISAAAAAYDFFHVYDDSTRSQIDFWSLVLGESAHDLPLCIFNVLQFEPLSEVAPLVMFVDRHPRAVSVSLEAGQPEVLWAKLSPDFRGEQEPPRVALRAPASFACLIAHGNWTSLVCPNLKREGRIPVPLCMDWRQLGIAAPVPRYDADLDLDDNPVLDSSSALRVADRLRRMLQELPLADPLDDFGGHIGEYERQVLTSDICTVHALHEQLSTCRMMRIVRGLEGKASVTTATAAGMKKGKFSPAWLVHVMLMANQLRCSQNLSVVLRRALHMCVPPSLRPPLLAMIDSPRAIAPSASQISRWRLLLDGAFMLHHREVNCASSRPQVRYLMSDSSTQHGRSLQMTTVMSVDADQVCSLASISRDLTQMWQMSAVISAS